MQPLKSLAKLFICCSIPEPKACLIFAYLRFRACVATFNGFLKWQYNKVHNRNKAGGVMGAIPRKYGWLYFI